MTQPIELSDRSYTPDEFFDLVEKLDGKYEYHDGRIVDWQLMAGATFTHLLICAALVTTLNNKLDPSRCRALPSDLMVRMAKRSKYRYPDVTILCGPPVFDEVARDRQIMVTNPTVIFEVLSDSSEKEDRGEKFKEYMQIESLREYVLVSQSRPVAEIFRRNEDGTWGIFAMSEGLDAELELKSVNVRLPLRDVYTGVSFAPERTDNAHGQ